jgi:hypothetical protein
MSELVLVRYTVAAGQEDRNAELVRAVYEELGRAAPDGFRYATLREGSAFTHVALHAGGARPLTELPAFRAFQAGLGERAVAGPEFSNPELVGSYRLLD